MQRHLSRQRQPIGRRRGSSGTVPAAGIRAADGCAIYLEPNWVSEDWNVVQVARCATNHAVHHNRRFIHQQNRINRRFRTAATTQLPSRPHRTRNKHRGADDEGKHGTVRIERHYELVACCRGVTQGHPPMLRRLWEGRRLFLRRDGTQRVGCAGRLTQNYDQQTGQVGGRSVRPGNEAGWSAPPPLPPPPTHITQGVAG